MTFRLYPSNRSIEEAALRYATSSLGLEQPVLVRSEADLNQIRNTEPQAVFLDMELVPAADAVARLARQGIHATWIGDARLADPQYAAIAGSAAQGTVIALGAPLPTDLSQSGDFAARYQAVASAAPGWRAPLAYDAANLLFDAIGQAAAHGSPSRSAVAEALRHIRHEGLIGPISFDAQGNWREAQVYVYRLENGRLVLELVSSLSP
jgi:branched-chain amino acid transport system substrate-binding protein